MVSLFEVLQDYANSFLRSLPTIVIALIVFFAFYLLSKVARRTTEALSARIVDDTSLRNLFGTIAAVAFIVVGIFVSATILFPGLRAGDLVGVLGLTSVAIGFAFKDIFQNFLAGILILSQRPFHIGDQIEVTGLEGTVEHISIRSTEILTYDGQKIILPNADLYTNPVTVRTARDMRRTTFETGIGYGEDIEEARRVIAEALTRCDEVIQDPPPQIYVSGHGESSIDFAVRYWTAPTIAAVWRARDQVGTAIKYALDEAGIEIPFPYRTVEFFDKTPRDDGGGEG